MNLRIFQDEEITESSLIVLIKTVFNRSSKRIHIQTSRFQEGDANLGNTNKTLDLFIQDQEARARQLHVRWITFFFP